MYKRLQYNFDCTSVYHASLFESKLQELLQSDWIASHSSNLSTEQHTSGTVPFIIVEHVLCGVAMVNVPIHYHNTAERERVEQS